MAAFPPESVMTARLAAALDALSARLEALPPDRQDAAAGDLLRLNWPGAPGGETPWERAVREARERLTAPPDPADVTAWTRWADEAWLDHKASLLTSAEVEAAGVACWGDGS